MRKYRIIEQTNCKGKSIFIPQSKDKGDKWRDFYENKWGSFRISKVVKSSYKKALKVIEKDKQSLICKEKVYAIDLGLSQLNGWGKNPYLKKTTPPPPPQDRIIREGQKPPKPKNYKK